MIINAFILRFFFLMWTSFKVYIELATILFALCFGFSGARLMGS